MPSLIDRLGNLGIQKGSLVTAPERVVKFPLEEILAAVVKQNQFGKVVIVEKVFPYGYQHGNVKFIKEVDNRFIHQAGKLQNQNLNLEKMIFLDTETTGLSGGTGTFAFLIGLAWFQEDGIRLIQLLIDDPYEEPAMLLEFSNLIAEKEVVVTFNGKSFDMPLLRSRFVLNRLPIPFSDWGHLDLLHLSRRIWRNRLSNRSLKDLEQEIIHIPRSDEEVPGWMIPEIYFNFLRSGDGRKLSNVVYHNAMDIISLAALYLYISNMLERDLFSENANILDVYAIGRIFQDIGNLGKARSIYEFCLTNPRLGLAIKKDINSRLAQFFKKEFAWKKAIQLWKDLGNSGDYDACIELAKYYEHEIRDHKIAFEWTLKAESNLEKSNLVRYKKKTLISELLLRKNRLEKRINHV